MVLALRNAFYVPYALLRYVRVELERGGVGGPLASQHKSMECCEASESLKSHKCVDIGAIRVSRWVLALMR